MDILHTFIGSTPYSMDPKTHNRPTHMDTPTGSPPHCMDLKIHNHPTHMDTLTDSRPHSIDSETYNCSHHRSTFIGSLPHNMDQKAHDHLTHMDTSNTLISTYTLHNTGFSLQPNIELLFPLYIPCPSKTCPKSTLMPSKWKELLMNYPDRTFTDNIVGMEIHGSCIEYRGPLH